MNSLFKPAYTVCMGKVDGDNRKEDLAGNGCTISKRGVRKTYISKSK